MQSGGILVEELYSLKKLRRKRERAVAESWEEKLYPGQMMLRLTSQLTEKLSKLMIKKNLVYGQLRLLITRPSILCLTTRTFSLETIEKMLRLDSASEVRVTLSTLGYLSLMSTTHSSSMKIGRDSRNYKAFDNIDIAIIFLNQA